MAEDHRASHDDPTGHRVRAESSQRAHVGFVPTNEAGVTTKEEHHEWALKLWYRIDRDRSGSVTSEELNCNEFQEVLKSVVAPDQAETHVSYGRAEINIKQAIAFCMRKADCNGTGTLSFEEFSSFLRALRNQSSAKHSAELIYALFDLNGNGTLDQEEFTEIFRYFSGRRPTLEEFRHEWSQLDTQDTGEITKKQYIHWLRTSDNPIFKQHAPPVEEGDEEDAFEDRLEKKYKKFEQQLGAGNPLLPLLRRKIIPNERPDWNERFNLKNVNLTNPVTPKLMRDYFQRQQSLPELSRYFAKHRGYDKHQQRVDAEIRCPQFRRKKSFISQMGPPAPHELPARHVPAGNGQRSKRGEPVIWNENWQEPRLFAAKRVSPGANSLRLPGKAPDYLFLGKDAPESDDD